MNYEGINEAQSCLYAGESMVEEEGGVRTLGAGSVKSVSGGEGCVSAPQVLEALLREKRDNQMSGYLDYSHSGFFIRVS